MNNDIGVNITIENNSDTKKELSPKLEKRLKKYAKKYQTNEKFLIASTARKTISYIEKSAMSFPNQYFVLRNKIIDSCYSILENVYRANIFQ